MMIELNYPEMLQQIKLSIFTGDHSAIYSLARSIACIAASFALITWYNKMINDPYGRFDMRAIIRTMIVLLLTCNFYSFVLVPVDYLTHAVTKGITASVDGDRDGIFGMINELYAAVEAHQQQNSLAGRFEEETGKAQAATEVDGLSYESSAITESIVEATIEKGEKPGLLERLWAGAKGFAGARVGMVLNNVGNVLSAMLSVVVKLMQYILYAVSSVYLMILGLIGPFSFALSIIPGFNDGVRHWLARYIQISFWIPVTALVDMVNIKIKGAMMTALWSAPLVERSAFPVHLIVMDLVTLVCLFAVPSIASWVISSSGASDVNRSVQQQAHKALMMSGKL